MDFIEYKDTHWWVNLFLKIFWFSYDYPSDLDHLFMWYTNLSNIFHELDGLGATSHLDRVVGTSTLLNKLFLLKFESEDKKSKWDSTSS